MRRAMDVCFSAQKHRHSVFSSELERNYNSHIHRVTHDGMQGCFQHFWSSLFICSWKRGTLRPERTLPKHTCKLACLLDSSQSPFRRLHTLQISCLPLCLLRRKTGSSHAERKDGLSSCTSCIAKGPALKLKRVSRRWQSSIPSSLPVFILPDFWTYTGSRQNLHSKIFWWDPRKVKCKPLGNDAYT